MPGPVILIFSPPVSQVRPAWRAYVLLLLLSSFSSSSSFNDRLEWSNEMISEPIPDRSSPNFQGWYLVDNLPSAIWYSFRDRSRDVFMATNFRRQIGEIGKKTLILGTRIPHGRMAKRMDALTPLMSSLRRIKIW